MVKIKIPLTRGRTMIYSLPVDIKLLSKSPTIRAIVPPALRVPTFLNILPVIINIEPKIIAPRIFISLGNAGPI